MLAVFLGYYFRGIPRRPRRRASARLPRAEGARTGYYDFADIDDDFISIHHWLKWYKFGFTRTFDNLSLEMRNGRMTRDARDRVILRERGDETPHDDIEKFCALARHHATARFFEIAERSATATSGLQARRHLDHRGLLDSRLGVA